jgi:NADH dehydrogenase
VLPELDERLSRTADRVLRRRGVDVRTGTSVKEATSEGVWLDDGSYVETRTLIWCVGVRPDPLVAGLDRPLERGRLLVDPFLNVPGHPEVFACGDAAAVPDLARSGQPCPPTCQHAIRQGRTVARNVAAALGTGRKRKFSYKTLGVFVDMGSRKAVAQTVGIKWRGFPAWFLARSYHLAMMPGVGRKMRLLIDWTVGLAFGHDVAEVGQLGQAPRLGEEAVGRAVPVGARSGPPSGPER